MVLANFLADIDNFNLFDGVVFEGVLVMIVNAITPNLVLIFLVYFEIILRVKRYLIRS